MYGDAFLAEMCTSATSSLTYIHVPDNLSADVWVDCYLIGWFGNITNYVMFPNIPGTKSTYVSNGLTFQGHGRPVH